MVFLRGWRGAKRNSLQILSWTNIRAIFMGDEKCRQKCFNVTIGNVTKVLSNCIYVVASHRNEMSRVMRKPAFCICENKGAGQLLISYIDTCSTIHKSEISSL